LSTIPVKSYVVSVLEGRETNAYKPVAKRLSYGGADKTSLVSSALRMAADPE